MKLSKNSYKNCLSLYDYHLQKVSESGHKMYWYKWHMHRMSKLEKYISKEDEFNLLKQNSKRMDEMENKGEK